MTRARHRPRWMIAAFGLALEQATEAKVLLQIEELLGRWLVSRTTRFGTLLST